jgi:hypothetical protein
MPQRHRILSAAVAAGGLIAAGVLAAPSADASSPQVSITAFLRAPNPTGLDQLAAAHGLTHAQRIAALARLVPSAATRASVSRVLAAEGLTVGDQTAWSITAHGPASVVASVFGARPAAVAHPTPAQLRAATGPLPIVPAALAPDVSLVFPTTGGPAPFHHAAAVPLTGTDFRNAYTSAGTTPPGGGTTDDGAATVATLQLADITSSDITKYASMVTPPLPNIVGTPQYHPVVVDGGPSATDDSTGGDVEVALDQESILSTSPSANQRPYFAPNTEAGFNDVFANVFDDVTQNAQANDGGNPNITALSSSWGQCELGTGAASIATTETLIKALVAAGVTVFASSGDDGIYDCRSTSMTGLDNSQADVDYPASSPEVVGVGGTNLQYTGANTAPNDGSNWNETSWTCSDPVSCESTAGTGGTGGGQSGSAHDPTTADSFAGFAAPAYQTATITKGPFANQPNRLVPDIAADGDPSTGFELYTSDPEYVGLEMAGDGFLQVGGTSLSSPISAALLTNTLAAAGTFNGVGDIHGALYSALHAHDGLRDVTAGTNGATADKGTDPSVAAHHGYDTNTGVGGVLWPAMTPYLLDTTRPTAKARLALKQLHGKPAPTTVTVTWRGKQGSDKLVLASSSVVVSQLGRSKPVFSMSHAPVSGSKTFLGKPGATYQVAVTTTDLGGNASTTSTARRAVPIDDARFKFKGAWRRKDGVHEIAGSYSRTAQAGATATVKATGTAYKLIVPTGPASGRLGVYLGKTLVKTVDLYNSSKHKKTVAIYGGSSTARASRTFHLRCLGTKSSRSAGHSVAVDALVVTY